MATVKVNISGVSELDFPTGVTSASVAGDVATLNLSGSSASTTHSESLTDGNSNFIFAGGDIVTVVGVAN